VLQKFEEVEKPIHVAYPNGRLLPSRIRALIDALRTDLRTAL
jgi:hypothetical protein